MLSAIIRILSKSPRTRSFYKQEYNIPNPQDFVSEDQSSTPAGVELQVRKDVIQFGWGFSSGKPYLLMRYEHCLGAVFAGSEVRCRR